MRLLWWWRKGRRRPLVASSWPARGSYLAGRACGRGGRRNTAAHWPAARGGRARHCIGGKLRVRSSAGDVHPVHLSHAPHLDVLFPFAGIPAASAPELLHKSHLSPNSRTDAALELPKAAPERVVFSPNCQRVARGRAIVPPTLKTPHSRLPPLAPFRFLSPGRRST